MTKSFQSIRQLFGRMLGNDPAGPDATASEYSTLGIDSPEAEPSTNGHGQAHGFAVENSEPDLEVQTADTRRLPQVAPEFLGSRNGGASQSQVAHEEGADEFGDAPLDLGDFSGGKAFAGDDPFLDVLDETVAHEEFFVEATPQRADPAEESSYTAAPVPAFEASEHWSAVSESAPASHANPANLSDLSPEAIDAIAERVVAQLSDKVVREIAWEVVPELSELLIKQKLKEK
jgi:hypothetical protein